MAALANNLNPDERRPSPKVIGLSEALDHSLPDLWRYGKPIHTQATRSRENLALYVLDRVEVGAVRWHDLEATWPRTERPGTHEPRSILDVEVGTWHVVVAHAPPNVPGSSAARAEWVEAMVRIMRAHSARGPVFALTDPNGLAPHVVKRLGPEAVMSGPPTDAVIGSGVILDAVHTPGRVNGVPMLGDHRRALVGRARARKD